MGGDLHLFLETVPWFHLILKDVLGRVIPPSRLLRGRGVTGGRTGSELFRKLGCGCLQCFSDCCLRVEYSQATIILGLASVASWFPYVRQLMLECVRVLHYTTSDHVLGSCNAGSLLLGQ